MKCMIQKNGSVCIEPSEGLSSRDGECVFSVKACGICGSDLPRVFGGTSYYYPIVLGHEFAGVVRESTDPSLIGKRACVFSILPCGTCVACQKQQWANCSHYDYYGSRRDGGMQSTLLIKETNLVFLPDSVSDEAGAMIEPCAVCLHAVRKAEITETSTVLIYGAGTIGLLTAMWARAMGASAVYVSDPDSRRLEMARNLGFDVYANEPVNIVMEASGSPVALNDAILRCEAFGRIVLIGHGKQDVTIPHESFAHILRKQLTLVGSWNSDFTGHINDWKDSVEAVSEGRIEPERLITHRFLLKDAADAFEMIGERKESYNKVLVVMNDEE